MEKLLKWMPYFCFIITITQSLPTRSTTSGDVIEVLEYCDVMALNDVIKLKSSPDDRDVGILDNMIDYPLNPYIDNDMVQRYIDVKRRNVYGDDYSEKHNDEYDLAFKNCLEKVVSESLRETLFNVNAENDKTRNEDFDRFDVDGYENGKDDAERTVNVKRNRNRISAALNPTGWRKRRSDSTQETEDDRFMRNVQELLEKRQRLQFNPTGW
ncbi:uncharacterized protein LOC128220627 isoform X2 [Mya arenaria]|nr:uncharacterized protein LOC128220627 isoform X2 [Mya arenaria]